MKPGVDCSRPLGSARVIAGHGSPGGFARSALYGFSWSFALGLKARSVAQEIPPDPERTATEPPLARMLRRRRRSNALGLRGGSPGRLLGAWDVVREPWGGTRLRSHPRAHPLRGSRFLVRFARECDGSAGAGRVRSTGRWRAALRRGLLGALVRLRRVSGHERLRLPGRPVARARGASVIRRRRRCSHPRASSAEACSAHGSAAVLAEPCVRIVNCQAAARARLAGLLLAGGPP